jgi:hypothetical protein
MSAMKTVLKISLISILLGSLTGCVVYEPRPRMYAYPAYEVYGGPEVVVVHEGYYHHGYWR